MQGAFGPIEARWELGRLVTNTANGNQSFGSLHRVWQRTFKHLDLVKHPPRRVLLLGLGTGSVPHILRNELKLACPISAIELDPVMIQLGKDLFGMARLTEFDVVQGDATVRLHAMRERYDLVVVDLFDDLDLARGADTPGFAHALRDRCEIDGTVCFNTVMYDALSERRCDRVRENLGKIFSRVDELDLEGVNRLFIAR